MSTSRPTADELVEAVEEFLRDDLRARLVGRDSFQCLVAANALGIVARQLRHVTEVDELEREVFAGLLGSSGSADALRERVARAIRGGELGLDTPGLLAGLRRIAEANLAIDNPKYRPVE